MQNVYLGAQGTSEIEKWITGRRFNKILLFTGKKSFEKGEYREDLEKILATTQVHRYSEINPNPDFRDIQSAYENLKNFSYDAVIVVGGGSVLDFAKILNFTLCHPEGIKGLAAGQLSSVKPLLAIPTTTGTGSESTQFATYYQNKIKKSLDTHVILPQMAIVDARFSITEPQEVAAQTGIDALVQAIESFWSCKATDESRSYSREALQRLIPNLVSSVLKPQLVTRQLIAEAANFAGRAIQITRTTAAHAVSYPLTSYFGIPHGHAVGLCLIMFFHYNGEYKGDKVNSPLSLKQAKERMQELFELLQVKSGAEAAALIESFMRQMNMQTRLGELGIKKESLDIIVENSYTPSRMNNNPFPIDRMQLKKLLESRL